MKCSTVVSVSTAVMNKTGLVAESLPYARSLTEVNMLVNCRSSAIAALIVLSGAFELCCRALTVEESGRRR